jgi:cytochrome c
MKPTMRSFPAAAIVLLTALASSSHAQDGNAARGRTLFQQQCAACHAMADARHGVGPSLQGLMGRAAGAAEGYAYSDALKQWGQPWTPANLDAFLSDPAKQAPGTRMVQKVPNAQVRKDIMRYLSAP